MKKIIQLSLVFLGAWVFSVEAALPDFRPLVKHASPAVVNISTISHGRSGNSFDQQQVPEIFRHFFNIPEFNQRPQQNSQSLGSGFIVSKDGYILTNHHVVKDADEIIVRLNDRRELEAKLIGADETTDLAVLKVEAKNLPTVKLGNSDQLEVGEWVVAIGSPFGFDYSVTAGIVSAKGRSLPHDNYVPFIQTDVAINPGNSGGPLFNLDGEVVGINSQIYTRSGGFMGVSFAIPINVALNVSEQLKANGRVSRGWLGVMIQEVNKELAESFGLNKAAGALVAQVMPNSPADESDLQSGDIITHFNGKAIEMSSDLPHEVGRLKPGSKAKLNVVRNGKHQVMNVTIGQLPDDNSELTPSEKTSTSGKVDRIGIVVADLSPQQQKSVGDGVVVREVQRGTGAQAGLINGDIITMVYGESIHSAAQFKQIINKLPANRSVPMRIVRRGAVMFIPLRIDQ